MAKKGQPQRAPTRRQLARSKKEQEQLRLIYFGLAGVGVLVLLVLAFGLYQTYVLEPSSPVVTVNDADVTTGAYRDRVRYERFLLDDQFSQIQAQLASLPAGGENDQFSQMLRNQYQQFASQLLQQRSLIDRQTVDTLIEDELVEAEATERGITVSPEEVTEFINRIVASREGGLTEAAVEETSTAAAEFTATAAVWTPTPTFTPSPTLTPTVTLTQTEALTQSESITPTATPADTPTPAPTPTPNIISGATLTTGYQNWITTLANNAGLDEATYREYIRLALLQDKLRETLGEDVPREEEQAHARHILVETEEEAQAVVERLNEGEEFADLAAEVSTDSGSAAQGGDLGWVPQGSFVAPVDEAVFSLPIGEVSEPIESTFGWHVIEVLEREERELSPGDYAQRQRQAYTTWLNEARAAATIEDFWTADKAPADSGPPTPSL